VNALGRQPRRGPGPAWWLPLLLLSGCVGFHWERDTRFERVPQELCDRLHPGSSQLDECLAILGAPLWVWETAESGAPGAVLAYGWFRADDRLFRVSFPLTQHAKGNFDYKLVDGSLHGLVLFFDEQWTLQRWRRGRLEDITADIEGAGRLRPANTDKT